MARNPDTLQLRYLQTLMELGNAGKSSVVIPLPINLMRSLLSGEADHSEGILATLAKPEVSEEPVVQNGRVNGTSRHRVLNGAHSVVPGISRGRRVAAVRQSGHRVRPRG
jgi:hypothetical protein